MIIAFFLVLIALSPSISFLNYIESHDCQRIIQLILLSLVLLELIIVQHDFLCFNKKIYIALFVLLLLAVASATHAIEIRYAIIEISVFTALFYFTFMISRFYVQDKVALVKQLAILITISILLNAIAFYVGYISAILSGRGLTWPEPIAGFGSVRVFNQYQLLSLAIICLPLLPSFNLKKNIIKCLNLAFIAWWVLLFYSASRGVIISWILAMIITAIVYKKRAWLFLRKQLTGAIGGYASYFILFKTIPLWLISKSANTSIVTSTVFRDTFTDRINLWKAASVMIKNFPILGVGPMNFYFYTPYGTHPHNSILQIAAEWGLPVTIIIVVIIFYAAKCWFKELGPKGLHNKDSMDQQLAIILFFTLIANGAYSLVDGVIVMPISQILMCTMIGLMIGQYKSKFGFGNTQELRSKFHIKSVIAGVTLLFLVISIMPELIRGLTSYKRFLQPGERAFSVGPNIINPRIWMQQRREN